MHVQFWGAARTVTGSMHLVRVGSHSVLLDCGLYQGRRKEAFQRNRELPFAGHAIDAVILSHAHIDHSGNLPSLVRRGFDGPIYSTAATRDLANYMLLDSAKIQESDVAYVNRHRIAEHQTPFEPLYETEDALATLRLFRTTEFGQWFDVAPGVRCRFHVAGHMLGAASVELDLTAPDGQRARLLFSGDIGRAEMPLLPPPQIAADAEFVIMEATYGNRNHPQGADDSATLIELVQRIIAQKGKLIIPAFSVGRTQEIVYRWNQLHEAGRLPSIKVFVDSPLAVDATDVYRAHPLCLRPELMRDILNEPDRDPLNFRDLYYIRSELYSKKLNDFDEPCVIISASGMCEAGRVLHHLKHAISQERNAILFTGYQAEQTLGRYILDGHETVKIFGKEFPVRASVHKLESTSGHADQQELLQWVTATCRAGRVRRIALVHAEIEAATTFKQLCAERGLPPCLIPGREQILPLDRLTADLPTHE